MQMRNQKNDFPKRIFLKKQPQVYRFSFLIAKATPRSRKHLHKYINKLSPSPKIKRKNNKKSKENNKNLKKGSSKKNKQKTLEKKSKMCYNKHNLLR